jgi:hypothetical protein
MNSVTRETMSSRNIAVELQSGEASDQACDEACVEACDHAKGSKGPTAVTGPGLLIMSAPRVVLPC